MAQTTTRSRRSSGGRARSTDDAPRITATNLTADDRRWLEDNRDGISKSALRAKWIHDPSEHEDRKGQTLASRSPEVVRAWAEARDAAPATASGDEQRPRTLRFDFPGFGGGTLRRIDWDAWLRTFQDRDLVFLFQEHRRDGRESNFFRLDNPRRQDG